MQLKENVEMITYNQPKWWQKEHESAWDRVKAAFKRDWEQTKHDLGGDEPDIHQSLGDTVAQAVGKQPIPQQVQDDDAEYAYRYGYGAWLTYGKDYPSWDDELEAMLEEDWEETNHSKSDEWERSRNLIRAGWNSARRS